MSERIKVGDIVRVVDCDDDAGPGALVRVEHIAPPEVMRATAQGLTGADATWVSEVMERHRVAKIAAEAEAARLRTLLAEVTADRDECPPRVPDGYDPGARPRPMEADGEPMHLEVPTPSYRVRGLVRSVDPVRPATSGPRRPTGGTMTPGERLDYLVALALEAVRRAEASGEPAPADSLRAAMRERMAQAAQVWTAEVDESKEEP